MAVILVAFYRSVQLYGVCKITLHKLRPPHVAAADILQIFACTAVYPDKTIFPSSLPKCLRKKSFNNFRGLCVFVCGLHFGVSAVCLQVLLCEKFLAHLQTYDNLLRKCLGERIVICS